MPRQLAFDLPVRSATGRSDFFVSPSNAIAVAQLDSWQSWPQRKLVLVGPEGAGKTHLSHVWATQSGATLVDACNLPDIDIAGLATAGPVAVEDIDRITGNATAETALFHLHNLVLAEGGSLLASARRAPSQQPFTLPDLQSRMQGTPVTQLDLPDDTLLAALLVKLFTDRQITVSPRLIPYLLARMDRSFAAAQDIVARLDRAALESGRKLSDRLAAQVLERPED